MYGFNGKEKSTEIASDDYDFGARIYDGRIGRWLSTDPESQLYPGSSPYNYALNTPISATDPDGKLIIFIGGLRLWHAGIDQRKFKSTRKDARPGIYKNDKTLQGYWRTEKNAFGRKAEIDKGFMNAIGDYNAWYASGSSQWNSKAKQRVQEGKEKAQEFHAMVQSKKIVLEKDETIKIVAHSHGGAHSAGFASQLMSYKDTEGKPLYKIEVIYYITSHQPTKYENPDGVKGLQYSHPGDAISSNDPGWLPTGGSEYGRIKGVNEKDFVGGDIMEKKGIGDWDHDNIPPCEGPNGNRCGHNVTDNDFILNIPAGQPGYIEPRKDTPKVNHYKKTRGVIAMIVKFLYRYMLISIAILGIMGCHSTYKLSNDDLKWNPYKGGEVLVFQSNQGDRDTIFVITIQREKTVDDPLAITPNYHQSLNVIVKHSDPTPPNEQRYLESSFFELYATRDKNTIFSFSLAAKKSWFYAESYHKNDLNKLSVQKLTIKNFTYDDVLKLEPQSMEYSERNEFVTAVYWSKSKGYVRYDLKNGLYWELQ